MASAASAGLSAVAYVDVVWNKEQSEEFYNSMLAGRTLLDDGGAADAALQEYYARQNVSEAEKKRLNGVAQAIDYLTDDLLGDYYQKWIDGDYNFPDDLTAAYINGTYNATTGFYKISGDNTPRPVKIAVDGDFITITAADYTYKMLIEMVGFDDLGIPYTLSGGVEYANGKYKSFVDWSASKYSTTDNICYIYQNVVATGLVSSSTGRTSISTVPVKPSFEGQYHTGSRAFYIGTGDTLPTIGATLTYGATVGAWGAPVALPAGNLTEQAWQYFNADFLPWVKAECQDLGFDYTLICPNPNGWYPDQPATEIPQRPTIPVQTRPYSPFAHPVTEPVDVTNDSGEVIGTEMQAVTNAYGEEEIVYNFDLPEIPEIKIPDATLPLSIDIDSDLMGLCGGIWVEIKYILDNSGLIKILLPVLVIGLLFYIIKYLGG